MFKNDSLTQYISVCVCEFVCDNVIWFRMSCDLCAYGKNSFIAFTYIPPSNSTFSRNLNMIYFQNCNYMPLGNVFVFGDFNGMIKDLLDFI